MRLIKKPTIANRERGATQIEFALTLITIMTVMFWTWELCMLVYTYTAMANAAKEGVRYGITHSGDTSGVTAQVNDYAKYSLHDISSISVSVTYPDGSSVPPNRINVSITYTYVPFIALWTTPPTIKAFASGRMVY